MFKRLCCQIISMPALKRLFHHGLAKRAIEYPTYVPPYIKPKRLFVAKDSFFPILSAAIVNSLQCPVRWQSRQISNSPTDAQPAITIPENYAVADEPFSFSRLLHKEELYVLSSEMWQ